MDIRNYLQYLFETCQLKETSIKRNIACIKAMFKWLENEEKIDFSPFYKADIRIRLPKRLPRHLTKSEIRSLINTTKSFLQLSENYEIGLGILKNTIDKKQFNFLTSLVVLEVLFTTGIRVGELTKIKESNIALDEGNIHIFGKGNRERYVFILDDDIRVLMQSYLQIKYQLFSVEDDSFLVNSRGKPASTQFIRKLLHKIAEKSSLERNVTPHMLRHTNATQLLEAGVDIRYVQRLLGHESISTTEIYTHVSNRDLQDKVCGVGLR